MMSYYHMCANGSDAKDFITTESEFVAAFNRVGLCSYLSEATVVAFSIEDSHPHVLLWGNYDQCTRFRKTFEDLSLRSIARRRGSLDGVRLRCEIYEVDNENYLKNVATYTIIQPTKDGKSVMPYDYLYGSGALYFRSKHTILPWLVNEDGGAESPVTFASLTDKEKRMVCGSLSFIPGDWLVCQGFILPTNYVDVNRFESIYRTCNSYRVFLASNKEKNKVVLDKMASVVGILIEDMEARQLCEDLCLELFRRKGTRHLVPQQRLTLARELLRRYHLCIRQLSTLTKLPEEELHKYLR